MILNTVVHSQLRLFLERFSLQVFSKLQTGVIAYLPFPLSIRSQKSTKSDWQSDQALYITV